MVATAERETKRPLTDVRGLRTGGPILQPVRPPIMIRPVVTMPSLAQAYAPWHIGLSIRTARCVMTSYGIDLRPLSRTDAGLVKTLAVDAVAAGAR